MNPFDLDTLARGLSRATSRRTSLQVLAGAVAAVIGLLGHDAAARRDCRLQCRRTKRGRRCRRICPTSHASHRICSAGSMLCWHSVPRSCRRVCRTRRGVRYCQQQCRPASNFSVCTNVLSDNQNCGACGRTCAGTCSNGHCLPPPPVDETCTPAGGLCFSSSACCNGGACIRGICWDS